MEGRRLYLRTAKEHSLRNFKFYGLSVNHPDNQARKHSGEAALQPLFRMKQASGKLEVLSAFLMLVFITTCQSVDLTGVDNKSMENELKAIVQNRRIPPDLSITYDDMHGLWGGTTIYINGAGSGETHERPRGGTQPQIVKTTIGEDQLLGLIKLLIELKAWEQRTPERQAVPDESKATLTITTGRRTSKVWEWFNDMKKNQQLIQIKARMSDLVQKK